MKKIIFAFALLIGFHTFSQKPEKVYSIVMERRELSWYQEQEKLWKQEIDKNKNNANAWYNYYQAVRAQPMVINDYSKMEEYDKKLDGIANDCYKTIPGSFEANLIMYKQFGGWQDSKEYEKYLLKAYEIDPLDPRTYVMLLTDYYLARDKKKFHEFCEKYYQANELAGFIYNLGYNFLVEVDSNAIIFTAGDNDTYPAWILQEVQGIRKDVTVLNTSLLTLDDYRSKMFEELGLPKFAKSLQDVKSQEEYLQNRKDLFAHILNNTKGYPVYVAVSAVGQFEADFGDDLYLTGLMYKYSKEPFDNVALIRRNYEKRYRLDGLKQPFAFHIQNGKLPEINSLYLPAFVKLYIHYRESEDWQHMKELEPLMLDIAKGANQESEIQKLLKD